MNEQCHPQSLQHHHPITEASAATASDSTLGNGELLTEDLGAGAERAGCGLQTVDDEEAPREPPQGSLSAYARDAANQANEGRRVEIIDDEESPPNQQYHTGREQREKAKIKALVKGSVEQIPASEPRTDEIAAMAHDDPATKIKRHLESVPSIAPLPLPDAFAALGCDDSLDLAKAKKRHTRESVDSIHEHEPKAEDESDAQPNVRDRSIITQGNTTDNRNRYDTRAAEPNPRTQTIEPATARSNTITADTQIASPYINENDEICIPEATPVDDSNIPAATVVRPDKYSLTIAGRKIRRRYWVLGILVMLGIAIASVVTLTRNKEVPEAVVPSGAPSVSVMPTSYPSVQPSSGPTTYPSCQPSSGPTDVLRGKIVSDITEYSEGKIYSFSSDNHRKALDWLVKDQSMWPEEPEKMPLSGHGIVERFVLALIYFETQGEDWSDQFKFMSKEHHVCEWRDSLFRTFRKGVMRCTDGSVGRRVTILELPDNKLSGTLPTELGLLHELSNLTLGRNGIGGSIPYTIGLLKNITHIEIGDNKLKGSLPTELGLLHELSNLTLGRNGIGGSIPDTIGLLENITHIELNNNKLVGPIDSLARLTSLQYIDLTSNYLTGPLMDVTNLTKLHTLKASANKFSGSVPKSFSSLSSLDIFILHSNDLSGDINFMCNDLPLDYQLDCYGDNPEVVCNCCIKCTKVSDESCDSDNEKAITLDIYAGRGSNGFEWELRDGYDERGVLIAVGGGYKDKERLNVQLCLSIKGWYHISTSQPLPPTLLPTHHNDGAKVSFSIDGYSSIVGPSSHYPVYESFYVAANPTSIPTESPTASLFPTISALPTLRPTKSVPPTSTSVGKEQTQSPTGRVTRFPTRRPISFPTRFPTRRPTQRPISFPSSHPTRPATYSPTPCDITFGLLLKTDAFGIDTSWDLVDKSNGAVIVSKGGFESNKTLSFEECLDPEKCYDFVIKDAWDDGICCQQGSGSYNVSVNGRFIGSGGEFGSSETVSIGERCRGGWRGRSLFQWQLRRILMPQRMSQKFLHRLAR